MIRFYMLIWIMMLANGCRTGHSSQLNQYYAEFETFEAKLVVPERYKSMYTDDSKLVITIESIRDLDKQQLILKEIDTPESLPGGEWIVDLGRHPSRNLKEKILFTFQFKGNYDSSPASLEVETSKILRKSNSHLVMVINLSEYIGAANVGISQEAREKFNSPKKPFLIETAATLADRTFYSSSGHYFFANCSGSNCFDKPVYLWWPKFDSIDRPANLTAKGRLFGGQTIELSDFPKELQEITFQLANVESSATK